MYDESMADYAFPNGSYWVAAARGEAPEFKH